MASIRIGLYGSNGHQLPVTLPAHVRARVTAVAAYAGEAPGLRAYATLEELLADPEVDLVSLCSPSRRDQPQHALACLHAGKHVLAEKPSAFTDGELDALLAASQKTGKLYREMADTLLFAPIRAIRRLVDSGALGTIVHVQAHKSYPWHDRRPQDMETDGGLTRQVGIHATRFIIGATGLPITSVAGVATGTGNPGRGKIQIAAAFACALAHDAVGSINLNYLNPQSFGAWGNDQIRVYGTLGMAESVDGFRRHRLYLNGRDPQDLPLEPTVSELYIEHYANLLLDGTPMPCSHAEEIAALRATIAMQAATGTGQAVAVTR